MITYNISKKSARWRLRDSNHIFAWFFHVLCAWWENFASNVADGLMSYTSVWLKLEKNVFNTQGSAIFVVIRSAVQASIDLWKACDLKCRWHLPRNTASLSVILVQSVYCQVKINHLFNVFQYTKRGIEVSIWIL